MHHRTIRNLSFIVIAKNEEFAIQKCLASLKTLHLENCEIILVDSGSQDDTCNLMLAFAKDQDCAQVFRCSGFVNAAVARNVGLRHATKQYLFFIDGDVAVSEQFILRTLEEFEQHPNIAAIRGRLPEIQYAPGYSHVRASQSDRHAIDSRKKMFLWGGVFVARREAATSIGEFDESFATNEDLDYSMRFSRKYSCDAIPIEMGTHHTIDYYDKERMRASLRNSNYLHYGRLLRKHIRWPRTVFSIIRRNPMLHYGPSVYALFLAALLLYAVRCYTPAVILAAVAGSLVLIDIVHAMRAKKAVSSRLFLHFVLPFRILATFLFARQPKRSQSAYEQLR